MTTSLYIHIPFCFRKCLFCSFVISVGQEHRRDDYVNFLIEEMKKYKNTNIETIYFGGGTPSSLDENHFESLMHEIRKNFSIQSDAEMTLEINPESISFEKAKFLKQMGFNRASLGVQSMDDRYLKFLGRAHDVALAHEAYGSLREAGFRNINVDLMYAFPGQSARELEDDVRKLCLMGSEHLSLYTLTIEPHSRFYATQMKLDDDEKLAEHYQLIARILSEYGFKQYEISNFSKPGFESAHNKNYWMGKNYIGIGVGAHGFLGHRRYWNVSSLKDYLDKISTHGEAVEGFEDLSEEKLLMEKILFGLRMNEGISFDIIPVGKRELIKAWINDGFFVLKNNRLSTTLSGRLVLDELSVRLI